jgi:hypothetical protein
MNSLLHSKCNVIANPISIGFNFELILMSLFGSRHDINIPLLLMNNGLLKN